MSWSIGYDEKWRRDIGYGVPAYCDHPDCYAEIDRGLSYVCGGEPYGGEHGCGLYFCENHGGGGRCERCLKNISDQDIEDAVGDCTSGITVEEAVELLDVLGIDRYPSKPFDPKPDHPDWIGHKETDPSWEAWRKEHAKEKSA